jgi:uncharacterized RDD family membrane protein YckC
LQRPGELPVASPPPAQGRVGLRLRLAALVYESILLFGVVFGASYLLLAAFGWTHPLPDTRRWVLQAVLFVVIGAYFVYCWTHGGQTLAMKAWRLRVARADGGPVSRTQAVLRYLVAWHLFLPGFISVLLFPATPWLNLAAFVLGMFGMLALMYLDPQRQLLHDRLVGTRVERAER